MHWPVPPVLPVLPVLFALSVAPVHAQQADPHTYRPGIDVLDYAFTVDLPDAGPVIAGRAVLTVRRYGPVDTLVLDLLEPHADSVWVNGRATAFRRDSATVRVPLPRRAGREDSLRVTVAYGGAVTDGLVVGQDAAGRWTYFGDNFPDRGRHWLPTVDHPSDKATVTWIVRAPTGRTVVANGLRTAQAPVPGTARTETRWRQDQPIATYLMVIAAAPLVEYSLGETACGFSAVAQCVPQSV